MKKISVFLIIILILYLILFISIFFDFFGNIFDKVKLLFLCCVLSGFGGTIYCLRGVYLNYSVHKKWDEHWEPWYYIRPFVSLGCGLIAFLILKAGLIILESQTVPDAGNYGYFAFSLISGYNVDNFISKFEDIAQSVFGINKSKVERDKSKK